MANATVNDSAPRKRGGWLKILGVVAGVLVVLLVAAYLVVTSSGFFKGVILPRASKSLGAEITVSDASISPFSQVVLHNLKVRTTGPDPLVTAAEVRARYNLRAILGGNILVDEVTLASPTVVLVENADGSSNLDPILKAQKSSAKPSSAPSQPGKPAMVDLRKLALTDATVRQLKTDKDGTKTVVELTHLNVDLEGIKNGATAKFVIKSDLKQEKTSAKPGESALLEGKVGGEYSFGLAQDLSLASLKGAAQLEVARAEGAMSELAGSSASLDAELTPTEIKGMALRLRKGDQRLGEIRASGPFSAEKKEGKFEVTILSVDRQLLNLAGAKSGVKFGTTTVNSTNHIELAKGGTVITLAGQVAVDKFQMQKGNDVTPTLDFGSDYDVVLNLAQSNAVLQRLNFHGNQRGKELLRGELTSPMRISWGSAAGEVGDSTFNFTLTGMQLPDWKPFLGDSVSAGTLSAQAKLVSQKAGDELTFDVKLQGEGLSAKFGSNSISEAGVTLEANGHASKMTQFDLKKYALSLTCRKQPVVSIDGSGSYTKDEKAGDSADMQVAVQASLKQLLELAPQPGSALSSGTVELKGHLVQKGKNQSVTGNLVVADVNGNVGVNKLQSFGATADLDVAVSGDETDIRKMSGKITQGGKAGGSFDVSGKFNKATSVAQITAKLAEFNETGLRPFLEPALGDKKLVTVALNANTSIQYDPKAASSFKGDLQLTKLVVNDPKKSIPATPLEAKFQFDVAMNKAVTDINRFQIGLTPTAKAKNEVVLSGHVDATQTNAIKGNLKLAAESLDLTTFYDLFMGEKPAASKQASGGTTSTWSSPNTQSQAKPEQEPAPINLPLQNFTIDASAGKIYLHEVELSGLQTTVKIDGGHVVIDPCKVTLNGAPATAKVDLDMRVTGFKYDLALNATGVPLAPYVNTFTPERKGTLSGTATANAQFKGQGITGPSLQKYLSGEFGMASTNLDLSIQQLRDKRLKAIVTVVAGLPSILKDPTGAGLSILGSAFGSSTNGLGSELGKSPIQAVSASGQVGGGVFNLKQAEVQSSAFIAQVTGPITLAPVLSNSVMNLPVSLQLGRKFADGLRLTPANTPTNVAYVKLADFYTLKGTVGEPKNSFNPTGVAKLTLQTLNAAGLKEAGAAQNILNQVLGGQSSTNSAGTNQSGNKAADLLQGVLGAFTSTNNAPQDGSTNQRPASVFDQILKKK
jgi:uncharacterized protein involved in outer membrane biogenesis